MAYDKLLVLHTVTQKAQTGSATRFRDSGPSHLCYMTVGRKPGLSRQAFRKHNFGFTVTLGHTNALILLHQQVLRKNDLSFPNQFQSQL